MIVKVKQKQTGSRDCVVCGMENRSRISPSQASWRISNSIVREALE